MRPAYATLCAAMALIGCASDGRPKSNVSTATDWRRIATEDDRRRLREWRTAFVEALAQASAAGHGPTIASEGALLEPDAALPWREPPPGQYRCRTIKLGAKSEDMLAYVPYPAFTCRIQPEGAMTSFAKLTGSQRPIGLLFPHAGKIAFLGTLQLGDEQRALQYGTDQERDVAGFLERIGDNRWRIIFPYPHFESTMDVLELVPAGS